MGTSNMLNAVTKNDGHQANTLIENISDTAFWVAFYRAMETERSDAHFRDPYARLLAGNQGERIARSMPWGKASASAMVVRTCVFDELIVKTVREGKVDTVLNLAAGFDTRPYRLPLPGFLHWVEVDQPTVINYKEQKLAAEHPSCRLESVRLDLADAASRSKLFSRIANEAKQVLILTEGLLVYLTSKQVESLAVDLHTQSNFHWWLTDLASPLFLTRVYKAWEKKLTAGNAKMQFAPEEGPEFFRQYGWKAADIRFAMDESHRLKREMSFAWLWRLFASKESIEPYRKMSSFLLLERT